MDVEKFLNQSNIKDALMNNNLQYVIDYSIIKGHTPYDIIRFLRSAGIEPAKYVNTFTRFIWDENIDFNKYPNLIYADNFHDISLTFCKMKLPKSIQVIRKKTFEAADFSPTSGIIIDSTNLKKVWLSAFDLYKGTIDLDDQMFRITSSESSFEVALEIGRYLESKNIQVIDDL